ncbi:MAG TPA: hypothetical protein VFV90_01885 [Usitatibacter sp.]|nr:hypothetical protein [Usitatibacter sp.]
MDAARAHRIGRVTGYVLAAIHAALMVLGFKEAFVWIFLFLDFPISLPVYVVVDMLLGMYHSYRGACWFIYLVIGTLWQLYWPRLVARLVAPAPIPGAGPPAR